MLAPLSFLLSRSLRPMPHFGSLFIGYFQDITQGSKKVPSGCPEQVDFPVRQVTQFSFSLAQWARAQASHLPTKLLKTCQGQARFESYLSKGQAGIQDFFQLCHLLEKFGLNCEEKLGFLF